VGRVADCCISRPPQAVHAVRVTVFVIVESRAPLHSDGSTARRSARIRRCGMRRCGMSHESGGTVMPAGSPGPLAAPQRQRFQAAGCRAGHQGPSGPGGGRSTDAGGSCGRDLSNPPEGTFLNLLNINIPSRTLPHNSQHRGSAFIAKLFSTTSYHVNESLNHIGLRGRGPVQWGWGPCGPSHGTGRP